MPKATTAVRSALPASTSATLQSIRDASTLILAEPTKSTSDELAPSTLSTITAAQKLHSGPITILSLSTSDAGPATPANIPDGVTSIVQAKIPNALVETISEILHKLQSDNSYTHILTPASKFGSSVLPRIAAVLESSPITDVVDVLSEDEFIRPLYAGNALCKVQSTEALKMISIRSTAFEKASPSSDSSASVETLGDDAVSTNNTLTKWIGEKVSQSDRPDLGTAPVVISGGRGMGSGDNFEMLETLADKLGGAVGASRAAVDAGMVPNDWQVGQTGKVVAPDLYIACGISGAIQHLSGMKDSKTIVAINKDAEAPIFQVADYGIVGDLFKVVPELTEKVKS